MISKRNIILASALALAISAPSSAQDSSANPSYGTLTLSSGFTPDPNITSVQAGGSTDASNIGSPCTGTIANAPDVRLNYSAGSLPLLISVASDHDTTLVINAPDGQWYCDDDSGEGVNPLVNFPKPMSGRYEIWVGTYSSGEYRSAQLHISELYSQ